MKTLLLAVTLSLTTQAFAATRVGSSAAAGINIARIERAIQLVNSDAGRVSLVELDNGGSTDISSAVAPSSLMLTYFQDGEMFNVYANFEIAQISSLVKARLVNRNSIEAEVKVRDERLRESSKKIIIDISELLTDAAHAESEEEFTDVLLQSSVSVK